MSTDRGATKARDDTLLVGPGRLGSTLAVALTEKGWPVAAVAGRRIEACESLARRLGKEVVFSNLDNLSGRYPVVILAVSDDAVAKVAGVLAEHDLVDESSVVLHLSGVHGSGVLEALAERGAAVGSMHPLQTFPDPTSAVGALPGSHWFYEGDPRATRIAHRIIVLLNGIAHEIDSGNKALYHASASIACNLLTSLIDIALEAGEAGGIGRKEMVEALYPLIRSAVDNTRAVGTAAALTGPISRGDSETVRMHVEAIAGMGDVAEVYRVLGRRSVELALAASKIDEATAAKIRRFLAPNSA